MTVYIIQEPRTPKEGQSGFARDLSSAAEHGHVVFIYDSGFQASQLPGPAIVKARQALKNFGPDDFLCWAGGDPACLIVAAGVAADVNMGKVQYLRWERGPKPMDNQPRTGFYIPVEFRFR